MENGLLSINIWLYTGQIIKQIKILPQLQVLNTEINLKKI